MTWIKRTGVALMVLVVAPLSASASAFQEVANPRVVVITTGGTIASRRGAPTLDGASLVHAVPQLQDYAEVVVEEFSRIGSSQMTPHHWLRLAKRVGTVLEADPGLAGIVITHGTDTMEETAFFLHLTVRDSRPVVLVGSMRSADEISPDGPANLLDAVRIATAPDAHGKGVLIAMNGEINSARDAWKTDNQRVQAFRSPELGVLGFADSDRITFYRAVTKPHTVQTPFDLRTIGALPRVELVTDYSGFDGSTIDYWIDRGVQGLVITGFAGGRLSEGTTRGVQRAVALGIPVVIASRVPGGRITGNPIIPNTVFARDLSPQKARILLMLALTRSSYPADITRVFERF